MSILVTGVAGFIGFHLTSRLLAENYQVIGVDHLNDYYDVLLKKERLALLEKHPNFTFYKIDIANQEALQSIFANESIDIVINLAAQAGVRYSINYPHAYVHSNLLGFLSILEACRYHHVKHLIYASSSSVYGANLKTPFSTKDRVDYPLNMYAASKKANELMAYSYSHLFQIPTTGLRFFTVYGPWGRPDMSYYTFTKNIIEGNKIKVFNNGDMKRDFTYIDDIVEGIIRLLHRPPQASSMQNLEDLEKTTLSSNHIPYNIYNIGNHNPIHLLDFIQILETLIGKKANIELLSMQPGDIKETFADITDLQKEIGFSPSTPLQVGLVHFLAWYRQYHQQ